MSVEPIASTAAHAWTGPDAERVAAVVRQVASRLADPASVGAVASHPDNRGPLHRAPLWEPVSLSHGHPGIALLHGELAQHDPGWADVAHAHLSAAMSEMASRPSSGLYSGPAAVAAAAQTCAGDEHRYAKLRRRLLQWVARRQVDDVATWTARREAGAVGVGWAAYDVVNGISGTSRLLLDAVDDRDESSGEVDAALTVSLQHLVELARPSCSGGTVVPGWWVPGDQQPTAEDQHQYPRGDFNLGLAHGVPGPTMLLTLAAEAGHVVSGQYEAIATMGGWLRSWVLRDDEGAYWPARVAWQDQVAERPATHLFTRSAWCYGAPGVAAVLYRAGRLLGMDDWCRTAVESLRAILRRHRERWHLEGPTVCHGYAGLMHILHKVGESAGDPVLISGARHLALMVLDEADPASPFLFQHEVPDSVEGWRTATTTKNLNVVGTLEGASGVACSLLDLLPAHTIAGHANDGAGESQKPRGRAKPLSWDRTLMLS